MSESHVLIGLRSASGKILRRLLPPNIARQKQQKAAKGTQIPAKL